MTCRAVGPELATPGCYCVCCGRPAQVDPAEWLSRVNHRAGVFSGFVRHERFAAAGERVIPGTNRAKSREWRKLDAPSCH